MENVIDITPDGEACNTPEDARRLHEAIKTRIAKCDQALLDEHLEIARKLASMRNTGGYKLLPAIKSWEDYVELVMHETGLGRTRIFTLAKLGKSGIKKEQVPDGMKPSVLLAAVQAIGKERALPALLNETWGAVEPLPAREAAAHFKDAVAQDPEKYLNPGAQPKAPKSKEPRPFKQVLFKHFDALDNNGKNELLRELEAFLKEHAPVFAAANKKKAA